MKKTLVIKADIVFLGGNNVILEKLREAGAPVKGIFAPLVTGKIMPCEDGTTGDLLIFEWEDEK